MMMMMQAEQVGKVGRRTTSEEERSTMNIDEESGERELEVRRGPWTVEEDFTLINYIAHHGEGRWNSLALSAGLKRTGKSCRLRWLNYLRPDVRRGNITLEEQLLILQLHSRWGNRWSKIAQHLPGRTDNEIKNYWRTRVQKHAKQLKCDVNSKQFKDTMRYLWMPRLLERIQAEAGAGAPPSAAPHPIIINNNTHTYTTAPENSSTAASSDSFGTAVSDLTECHNNYQQQQQEDYYPPQVNVNDHHHESLLQQQSGLTSPTANYFNQGLELEFLWMDTDTDTSLSSLSDTLWNIDDDPIWLLHQ